MLFPTVEFALFFAIVFGVAWSLSDRPRSWRWAMLGASYLFYGWWDWRFVSLIILSSLVNHAAAREIARRTGRARDALIWLAVAFNLGLLGWFKYYGFFVTSVEGALARVGLTTGLPLLDIVLPVGISFFTFQALSYVIDVYRGTIEPVGRLDFAVYLAFFPQLVAGPIVRASEFLPQLERRRRLDADAASRAAVLICGGLFKKVVVSSALGVWIVDPVFAVPAQHSSAEILFAAYGYAIQIYADFSAYSDIAIGIALLLGFRFPDNFDRPYAALSIRDFWRRWHMTLSRWLRDYLYIPLGGSRKGRVRTYVNLLITMVLGGLWHGAAMTFIAWGALHGAALAVERALGLGATQASGVSALVRRLVTFHVVCAGWIFFRADTFGSAATMFERLVTAPGPAPLVTPGVVMLILFMLGVQLMPRDLGLRFGREFGRLPLPAQGAFVGVFIFLVVAIGPRGVSPFIYFRF